MLRAIFSTHDVADTHQIWWVSKLPLRPRKSALRLHEVERIRRHESLAAAIYSSLPSTDVHRRLEAFREAQAALLFAGAFHP